MDYSRDDIKAMLCAQGAEKEALFRRASEVKLATVGSGVWLRGLIEYSNVCRKNCLYCGIRRDFPCERYTLTDHQVLDAARYAVEQRYGSVVIQGGENQSPQHVEKIAELLRRIKEMSPSLGITLSLGEQSLDTYIKWREAGADRYLLRIESSNPELYCKIHPGDRAHTYQERQKALRAIRESGLQVGTGVMIGLPFQSVDDLAGDLLFMKGLDIDMCGMGPYIVSHGTPLADYEDQVPSVDWRIDMTLKMIATLRLLVPDINIAATTALQTLDPDGRRKALEVGANVIMPNVTPEEYRPNYSLYDNKPLRLDSWVTESDIRYGESGDSLHFRKRTGKV